MTASPSPDHPAPQPTPPHGVVTSTETRPSPERIHVRPEVRTVIVAVHGVGDQYSYATIQSVVNQFCGFCGEPAAVPLGSFHSGQPVLTLAPPHDPDLACFAFAEVYWATYPRELVKEQYTLEESKRWACTIVERLRLRAREEHERVHGRRDGAGADARLDYRLLHEVLAEMIQTIAVADRLCTIGDRAGAFKFNLRQLLDDYLGDVQVVTEFRDSRDKILEAFATTLRDVHVACPNADIHIVAHSEGTVVALLGLLEAFRADPAPAWTTHARGLMTIGSPIDKHLTLWPRLFADSAMAKDPPHTGATPRIQWRNYYDYGDPIGFELDDTRLWIAHHEWDRVFAFREADDVGFTRYPFPGKAHVDYWNDGGVFGHFIEDVVLDTPKTRRKFARPKDRPLMTTSSYVVPYVGVAALMTLAAYVLYKAVSGAVEPAANLPAGAVWPGDRLGVMVPHVAGLAALLLGTTIFARLPRLAHTWYWWAAAAGAGVAGALAFVQTVGDSTQIGVGLTRPAAIAAGTAALALGGLAATFKWRLRSLIVAGTVVAAVIVGYDLVTVENALPGESGPLWPVALATIAFLYLWWLGALFFDLVFVWHRYVRHSQLQQKLTSAVPAAYGEPRPTSAPAHGVAVG